jgi:uncharacterized protein
MSLLLSVADLEREAGQSLDFRLTGSSSSLDLPDGVSFGPVTVEGRALWTGETVFVGGRVAAEAGLVCGRCLEPFMLPVRAELAREYREVADGCGEAASRATGGQGDGGKGTEWSEAPLPFSRESIDLAFPVFEALVLELPMKPVCREDCPGLCLVCGANLDESPCGCRAEKADSRFLPLKRLLEAKERGE